jgi:hypothetical protein
MSLAQIWGVAGALKVLKSSDTGQRAKVNDSNTDLF